MVMLDNPHPKNNVHLLPPRKIEPGCLHWENILACSLYCMSIDNVVMWIPCPTGYHSGWSGYWQQFNHYINSGSHMLWNINHTCTCAHTTHTNEVPTHEKSGKWYWIHNYIAMRTVPCTKCAISSTVECILLVQTSTSPTYLNAKWTMCPAFSI